ncbi:MAG: 50S ribosomal protein L15 [Patescibacteria group bacterium]|jgi:large subunit ribosomal protein L15
MVLTLSNLKPASGSKRKKKRVGRGNASGHGTYSTSGLKGQRSRSGGRGGLKLKGLKNRLQKIPKLRGFTSQYSKPEVVKLKDLEKYFPVGAKINVEGLKKHNLIHRTTSLVKVLGGSKLTKKFTIQGCAVSAGAKKEIEAIGGKVL